MRRWISYYVRQYPKQIITKAKPYLDSKKLTLEDWLRCVKDGRCGDILCMFLLSLSTGVHTVVHLKNNKLWSTLKTIPATHSELLNICDQHLAYLGFGIFLRLERKPTQMKILGTITGIDHETQQLLLQSIDAAGETSTHPMDSAMVTIKTSHTGTLTGTMASTRLETKDTMPPYTAKQTLGSNIQLTGITLPGSAIPSVQGKPKASAAAGSQEQLPRLQVELSRTTPSRPTCTQSMLLRTTNPSSWRKSQPIVSAVTKGEQHLPPSKTDLISTTPQGSNEDTATTARKRQSKVRLIPFQVQLTRLSEKQLGKYMHNYASKSAATLPCPSRLSPIVTRSLTKSKQPQCKKRLISGHPSKINVPTYSFQIRRHFLCKHRHCIYLKCRVRGCTLAYASFNRLKDLNTHHRIYHPTTYYKCRQCRK